MTARAPSREVIPSAILATSLVVFAELMLFCGLTSSYIVLRGATEAWPPLGQPRLSIFATGINTAVLLASGATIWRAVERLRCGDTHRFRHYLFVTFLLGLLFLGAQGMEWVQLIGFGMTSASSLYGSLYYTIVGCHGLHVVVALGVLGWFLVRVLRKSSGALDGNRMRALRIYWLFVVGVWPPLYALGGVFMVSLSKNQARLFLSLPYCLAGVVIAVTYPMTAFACPFCAQSGGDNGSQYLWATGLMLGIPLVLIVGFSFWIWKRVSRAEASPPAMERTNGEAG